MKLNKIMMAAVIALGVSSDLMDTRSDDPIHAFYRQSPKTTSRVFGKACSLKPVDVDKSTIKTKIRYLCYKMPIKQIFILPYKNYTGLGCKKSKVNKHR